MAEEKDQVLAVVQTNDPPTSNGLLDTAKNALTFASLVTGACWIFGRDSIVAYFSKLGVSESEISLSLEEYIYRGFASLISIYVILFIPIPAIIFFVKRKIATISRKNIFNQFIIFLLPSIVTWILVVSIIIYDGVVIYLARQKAQQFFTTSDQHITFTTDTIIADPGSFAPTANNGSYFIYEAHLITFNNGTYFVFKNALCMLPEKGIGEVYKIQEERVLSVRYTSGPVPCPSGSTAPPQQTTTPSITPTLQLTPTLQISPTVQITPTP